MNQQTEKTEKTLNGYWLTFEIAKDKQNIEPSQVRSECVDWYNRRIFVGRIYE